MDIRFLFSAHHLMMVYICTKFMKIFSMVLKLYRADMIFIGKIQKGIILFVSAHHLMMVYICTKFYENILHGIKVIEQTKFSKEKNSKGHNSIKNVGGVTVLVLCTSSDGGLYFVQSFMKIVSMVLKL